MYLTPGLISLNFRDFNQETLSGMCHDRLVENINYAMGKGYLCIHY
jgi:hypothetical protein